MRKIILAFAVAGCVTLLSAQNGYAYEDVNGDGCLSSCHNVVTLHANTSHLTCANCHGQGVVPAEGTVQSAKCIACHPAGNVGLCNLAKTTAHATAGNCATCHTDCSSTCPASKVLGAEDPRLAQLRIFRDTVLAKSAFGKRIINSYYNNADAINAALEKNPTLKAFSYKALQSFIPVLEIFM